MTGIRKYISALLTIAFIVASLCACTPSDKTGNNSDDGVYIEVDGEKLTKEYIGYFFYLAQSAMLEEAGYTNSTSQETDTYWETAKIEGKNAVDVARDIASDNAVSTKVQYLKAVQEGITLSEEEEKAIDSDIEKSAKSQGGNKEFEKTLESMGTNVEAYRQTKLENVYIQKLYDKYDSQGLLNISDEELAQFSAANEGQINPEQMTEYAKSEKFNAFVDQWKKESNIVIDDNMMKNFDVK